MNEAISDIFSVLMQHDVGRENPFQVGSDSKANGEPLRDLADPANGHYRPREGDEDCLYPKAFPDHLSKKFTGECDSFGVHVNVGIVGNAFALMATGGTNRTSGMSVKALGWDGAGGLWWATQRFVLLPSTTISSLARWQIAIAKQMQLSLGSVTCAWVATGVVDAAYASRAGAHCGT